jgi:hypothetical protein
MKFFVIGHISYDYEYCEFILEEFSDIEQAKEYVKKLLNTTYGEKAHFNANDLTVIAGGKLKVNATSAIIEVDLGNKKKECE